MGLNKFSDMTDSEFASFKGHSSRMNAPTLGELGTPANMVPVGALPDSIDWRQKKVRLTVRP